MKLAIACALVIVGAAILIGALLPVRRLIKQLPEGKVRRNWFVMAGLIKLFIFGYLGYLATLFRHPLELHDLLVPGVFFFGACFVWLTIALSLQTAIKIRRVTMLEQENITDPLTCIYNRRYLERRLNEEFDRAMRYNSPFSILLIDIDHFKSINDTYGHKAGDMALCYLSKQLQKTLRASDVVARFGGEEFVIMAPNTELEVAQGLAERLRQYIESRKLVIDDQDIPKLEINLTVSIGVADNRSGCRNYQEMLELADHSLYRAKKDGRNRVMVARNKGLSPLPTPA